MPRRSVVDGEQLSRVLDGQHQVITRGQLLACGMPRRTVDFRTSGPGRWQRLLPGVYLTLSGTPTQEQRETASLLYAGPCGIITGPTAVRLHHLRCAGPDVVDVLLPWNLRLQSVGFVRVHRTRRLPASMYRTGPIRFAEPPRAVADAARWLSRFDDVRAVVCEAVQRRSCSIAELGAELNAGPSAGSARFRTALAEVGDGVRSVAEADFRKLILGSALPAPMFNARLFDADGGFIAMVDAWWQDAGVAADVDSRAYHLSAADQDRDAARHAKLITHGVFPLHYAPQRIKKEGPAILAELHHSLIKGRNRPALPISALPAPD
jgi:hypothetical protein